MTDEIALRNKIPLFFILLIACIFRSQSKRKKKTFPKDQCHLRPFWITFRKRFVGQDAWKKNRVFLKKNRVFLLEIEYFCLKKNRVFLLAKTTLMLGRNRVLAAQERQVRFKGTKTDKMNKYWKQFRLLIFPDLITTSSGLRQLINKYDFHHFFYCIHKHTDLYNWSNKFDVRSQNSCHFHFNYRPNFFSTHKLKLTNDRFPFAFTLGPQWNGSFCLDSFTLRWLDIVRFR